MGIPKVEEKIMLGGDIARLAVLDITTVDSERVELKQREIRLTLYPFTIEISHHKKRAISIGCKVNRYKLKSEFQYGIFKKV